jgi:hypothetical protein
MMTNRHLARVIAAIGDRRAIGTAEHQLPSRSIRADR